MIPTEQATQLRRRAARLRTLAAEIEMLPVLRLDTSAREDTWRGRRPSLCRATLATNQHQLYSAADGLRWQAYRLEHHADELDAIARSRIGLAG